MTAFEYLENHVMTKLSPSRIEGVGVFALRDIKKGEQLFAPWPHESGSYYITIEQFNTLNNNLQKHLKDTFGNQIYNPVERGKFFIRFRNNTHWIYITPKYFINSGFEKSNIDYETCTALRDIKSGEEILANYNIHSKDITLKNII